MKLSWIKKELKSNYNRLVELNNELETFLPKMAMLGPKKDETSKAALAVIRVQMDEIEFEIHQIEMANALLEQELLKVCYASKTEELNKVKLPTEIEEQYGTPRAYVEVNLARVNKQLSTLDEKQGYRYKLAKDALKAKKEENGYIDPSSVTKRDMGSSIKSLFKSKKELEEKEREAEALADEYLKTEEKGEPNTPSNGSI